MANEPLNSLGIGGALINQSQIEPRPAIDSFDPNADGFTEVPGSAPNTAASDIRVRLRCMRDQETQVYGEQSPDNIMSILHPSNSGTDGLLFPYTPQISVSQEVNYKSTELHHTNGDIQSYDYTPSVGLSISADFTVQNQREGRYALAALHFLRTVSKMYFGETDAAAKRAGLPPPVLVLSGYGNYMLNNLPVILKSHSYSLEKNANMVTINTAGGTASLPSMFNVTMNLSVQQTPKAQRSEFSLDEFRTGALMRKSSNTGWI